MEYLCINVDIHDMKARLANSQTLRLCVTYFVEYTDIFVENKAYQIL